MYVDAYLWAPLKPKYELCLIIISEFSLFSVDFLWPRGLDSTLRWFVIGRLMALRFSLPRLFVLAASSVCFFVGLSSVAHSKPDAYTHVWSSPYEEGDLDSCLRYAYVVLSKNGYANEVNDNQRDEYVSVYGWNDDYTLIGMMNCDVDQVDGLDIVTYSLTVAGSDSDTVDVFKAYKAFSFD